MSYDGHFYARHAYVTIYVFEYLKNIYFTDTFEHDRNCRFTVVKNTILLFVRKEGLARKSRECWL